MIRLTQLFVLLAVTVYGIVGDDHGPLFLKFKDRMSKDEWVKCAESAGSTVTQMNEMLKNHQRSSEVQCFLKCIMETTGIIGSDGKIDLAKAKDDAPKFLTAEEVDELVKCLEGIDKIASCEDMKKFHDCKPKAPA
ncbi:uncharacterized protein LOC132706403 [Cylas formicarius]|uniref:uncharacterized protein LOC132706403 n=1 Tax=Cylas formicarius TaxID=197179 RepID=UPI002958AE49|nr:uncharacterized protein LOC132706403 [Cylas formicarius]